MLGNVSSRTYFLVVEGELSNGMAVAFDDIILTREEGNTVLTRVIRDQAELHGLIQRVSDLGLTLLTVSADRVPEG
jgi:hypothetical protein